MKRREALLALMLLSLVSTACLKGMEWVGRRLEGG